MKLSPKSANRVFTLLVSVLMTAVMSLAMLLVRQGLSWSLWLTWLTDLALGSLFSIPTGFMVVPLLRRWVDAQTVGQPDTAAVNTITKVLVDQYANALNNRDVQAFADLFHQDAQYINVVGKDSRERDALAQWHQPLVDGSGRNPGLLDFSQATIQINRHEVRLLTDTVAVMQVYWTQYGAIDPAGNKVTQRSGLSDWVVTLESGKWLIRLMNNKDLPDRQ